MKPEDHPAYAAELRGRAEAAFQKKAAQPPESLKTLSPEATDQLLHELRVHQIELEMQNEELRRSQVELNVSRARYFDLYDLAPVGYVTLDSAGIVLEANLTLATMLGLARGKLVGSKFTRFVPPHAQDALYLHQRAMEDSDMKQACELDLRRADGTTFTAQLETIGLNDGVSGDCHQLSTISDISGRKRLEAAVTTATEEERGRIARDLHDGLGQGLASTLFLSNVLQRDLTERGATEAAQATQIHALIEQSLAQTREIARGLYPVPPEPDGLMTALQNLADHVTRGSHIKCSFDTDSAVLIDDLTLATHLYRIAQEAVNNAFKHSGTDRIDIRLAATARTLEISVRDHGTGLPQNPPASTGLGRKTMEHRAQLTGGQLTVQNAPEGGGVIVSCWVTRVRRNPIETLSYAPRGKTKEPA